MESIKTLVLAWSLAMNNSAIAQWPVSDEVKKIKEACITITITKYCENEHGIYIVNEDGTRVKLNGIHSKQDLENHAKEQTAHYEIPEDLF